MKTIETLIIYNIKLGAQRKTKQKKLVLLFILAKNITLRIGTITAVLVTFHLMCVHSSYNF